MDISELTLKLIIILIPGAIATIIIEALTIHKKWTPFRFILNSILLGGLSYLILQLIYYIIDWINCTDPKRVLDIWENFLMKEILPYNEVLWGTLISIFLGFGLSGIIYYKVIFRISKFLKLSYKFGDDSLYYTFLNSPDIYPVYVRDIKNKKTYHGFVDRFSENEYVKEITLRDVDVYDYETSELIYNVPRLYLSKNQTDDLIIEIPNFKDCENEKIE